ncbi:uncharacterized protein KQ657_001228 [Scheffersomyces spartinae]|uniref:Ammonia transport outward protein 2 n=1 Tax=Scheffersomyces spartinae TaxID=45513 RepID=A0A9P7V8D4_9ASCO|nr:uncharacterized protein KQ657_001228 [Scheffersomyces spartinae]KAG7193111.1 hypothetical protein KQ657_001228 [Scheffersomyces spartinae]
MQAESESVTPNSTKEEVDGMPTHRVSTAGHGNEFIILGNRKYYRHELMTAFAGNFNPERYAPYPVHQFGNASALSLSGFGISAFCLGLYYAGAMGIKTSAVAVSLCVMYGGLVQLLGGVWELAIGNSFAGCAFTSFGAFWIATGCTSIPAFGIAAAYADDPAMFANAQGFYLLGWMIFSFLLLMLVLKATWPFVALLTSLTTTFAVLAAANFTGKPNVLTAGGVICVITAFFGWYCAWAGVANKQNSYFTPLDLTVPIFGKSVS